MVREICLDSDILIGISNNNQEIISQLSSIEDAYLYTTTINVFELWSGRKKEEPIKKLLNNLKILDFDYNSSIISNNLRKYLKKAGKNTDFRDIIIASICISNEIELLTLNIKHFSRLENYGLNLV